MSVDVVCTPDVVHCSSGAESDPGLRFSVVLLSMPVEVGVFFGCCVVLVAGMHGRTRVRGETLSLSVLFAVYWTVHYVREHSYVFSWVWD